jgi:hypothetical protein
MEAEIREILVEAVREESASDGAFTTLLERFGELGGLSWSCRLAPIDHVPPIFPGDRP